MNDDLDLVIVGAGFAGLAMLHRARESGLRARVIEAGSGVGGTWFWNRYPGARTDSECYYYQLSFSKELVQEWTWSERYPGQPEMLRYLDFVADKFDLRRDITFSTRVTAMEFREDGWDVTTDSGELLRAKWVVTGLGFLTHPHVPEFPGLDSFAGDLYLTCRWPAEGVDLAGKRVGIIGTGATGVQAIPIIAQEAASLTVFQRTPNYVVPAQNRPLEPDEIADLKARHYEILAKARGHSFAMPFDPGHGPAMEFDEEERRRIFEDGWARGGFRFLFETFDDLILDPDANEAAAEFIRSKIREIVHDPEVAELLSPRGYPYSGKRPPAGHDYYEAYNRDNVTLVDVSAKGAPIREITPAGVRTADAEYEFDVLVLATGFDAVTGALTAIDVRGRDGLTLKEKWLDAPKTYLGLTVAGFPNLFMISGPMSPFANLPVCIEKNVEWIGNVLDHARAEGVRTVEATEEAEADWGRRVQEAVEPTLLTLGEGVHSWFTGANIPGKAHVVNVWFGGANNYFAACDEVAERGYEGLRLTR